LKIKSLLREPLLHFLLIGGALFSLYGKVAPPADEGKQITVTQSGIAALADQFQATRSRPPTPVELQGLFDGYVRDEVLFREGVALGLLDDDPVIKRRVRQKLEVLIEEEGRAGTPSDAQLSAYLGNNAAKFRIPPVLSFEQLLFDPTNYGDELESALSASIAALNGGATLQSQGKLSLLPGQVEKLPLDLVIRDFGEQFGKALESAPLGQWFGPVSSGFGVHLVRINERQPAFVPALDEARRAVLREWENDQREAALANNYARLLKEYVVVIEGENAEATGK